jgi:hypothetical protein
MEVEEKVLAEGHPVFRDLEQVRVDEVVKVLDHDAADQLGIDGGDYRNGAQVASPEADFMNQKVS